MNNSVIPTSLYIHFPWCLRKCPYCDFNSYALEDSKNELITKYIEKLFIDLENEVKRLSLIKPSEKQLVSIYFGGGTPSLIPPKLINETIQKIKQYFSLDPKIEITLEANPGTINHKMLGEFKCIGINRISLGVQSFNDQYLKRLGRIHTSKQAVNAIEAIKHTNFSNFNLDLMFGLPQQNQDDALLDLKTAIEFTPKHISWYQLTIESGSGFFSKPPILPSIDKIWNIQISGQNMLKKSGFIQYEVSAYNIPEYECQHNINYWRYGDYIGIGAGACGKLTSLDNSIIRYTKNPDPIKYINTNHLNYEEKNITYEERQFEFMLNTLRLYRPITYELFYKRTGITINTIKNKLEYAKKLGLLKLSKNTLTVTKKGKNFLNNLLEIFL